MKPSYLAGVFRRRSMEVVARELVGDVDGPLVVTEEQEGAGVDCEGELTRSR